MTLRKINRLLLVLVGALIFVGALAGALRATNITALTISSVTQVGFDVSFTADGLIQRLNVHGSTPPGMNNPIGFAPMGCATSGTVTYPLNFTPGTPLSSGSYYGLTFTGTDCDGIPITFSPPSLQFAFINTLSPPTPTPTVTPTFPAIPTLVARAQTDMFTLTGVGGTTYTAQLADVAMPDSGFLCNFVNGTVTALTITNGRVQLVPFSALGTSCDPCFNGTFVSPCAAVKGRFLTIEDPRGRLLAGVAYCSQISYMTNDAPFTPTPTVTITPRASATPSATRTVTVSPTATQSPVGTRTNTKTATPTFTPTFSSSVTKTPTPPHTATPTFTATFTRTVTRTPSPTATPTP